MVDVAEKNLRCAEGVLVTKKLNMRMASLRNDLAKRPDRCDREVRHSR
jgi:hypothetical protein